MPRWVFRRSFEQRDANKGKESLPFVTGVIHDFAKVVHLSLESVFGLSVSTCLVNLISSDALKLVSGGKS